MTDIFACNLTNLRDMLEACNEGDYNSLFMRGDVETLNQIASRFPKSCKVTVRDRGNGDWVLRSSFYGAFVYGTKPNKASMERRRLVFKTLRAIA